MSTHELTEETRPREFVCAAVCSCGHVAEGPNPDTARKRHEVHESIEDARAALKGGTPSG